MSSSVKVFVFVIAAALAISFLGIQIDSYRMASTPFTHSDVPVYLKQNLELTKRRIEGVFGKEKERQEGLGKWFG